MKQATSDITLQNNTQGKNSDVEILDITYFHSLYLKNFRKFAVDLKLYKKVVKTYLKIYFTELYMNKVAKYFFLGGQAKLVLGTAVVFNKATNSVINKNINIFWYNRPSKKMWFMVTIKKMKGSSSALSKIENFFHTKYNKDLLPIFTKEQKKGKNNKTLYRCIPS